MKILTVFLACIAILVPAHGLSGTLPIIDAHSQFDEKIPVAKVIEYASRAGVSQILLSARGRVTTAELLDLGSTHPTCIVPSVRTKGRAFEENQPGYYALLYEQIKEPAFRAMSEILLVHAPKGKRAPEINVAADTPQVREAVRRAIDKGWPVVLHYEFRWLTSAYGADIRSKRMGELKLLLSQYPQHLVLRHPERFVLALDNVWPEHWSERYMQQVELWRKALGKLPNEVAHAVAHGNAERQLSPAVMGQGCGVLKR
jgi:hypothetical protein